jgi:hypothetical protein
MCENKEVKQNDVLAELLAQNLDTMRAEACELPVKVGDKEYVVNVKAVQAGNKPKIGMYGETPEIKIGKFIIREMTLPAGDCVWIDNEVAGDGAALCKVEFEKVIEKFYNDNF